MAEKEKTDQPVLQDWGPLRTTEHDGQTFLLIPTELIPELKAKYLHKIVVDEHTYCLVSSADQVGPNVRMSGRPS